jgi:hypothetical protein
MFSWGGHKQQLDVQKLLRRAIDASSPNLPPTDGESRYDTRSNRTLPLVLIPWQDNEPRPNGAVTALSKNLSSHGLTVLHVDPIEAEQVVVGFCVEKQPYFILGAVRHRTPLGGGFFQLGIELSRVLTPTEEPALETLVEATAGLAPC